MTDPRQLALDALNKSWPNRSGYISQKSYYLAYEKHCEAIEALTADLAAKVEPDYEDMYKRGFQAFDCPVCGFDGAIAFEPKPQQAEVPAGFVLVPIKMTRAMLEVIEQDDWMWADLLVAAEAVTEDQYEEMLEAAPRPAP